MPNPSQLPKVGLIGRPALIRSGRGASESTRSGKCRNRVCQKPHMATRACEPKARVVCVYHHCSTWRMHRTRRTTSPLLHLPQHVAAVPNALHRACRRHEWKGQNTLEHELFRAQKRSDYNCLPEDLLPERGTASGEASRLLAPCLAPGSCTLTAQPLLCKCTPTSSLAATGCFMAYLWGPSDHRWPCVCSAGNARRCVVRMVTSVQQAQV